MAPTIGSFHILPISIPPLPSYPHAAVHYIYLRRNEPRVPTPADARSLFLSNLPVDSTETHLRGVFASLIGIGRFESVVFERERERRGRDSSDLAPAQAVKVNALAHSRKRKRGGGGGSRDDGGEGGEEDDEEEIARRAKEDAAARLPETWTRPLHRSGGTAVVVLADEKSVEQVLKVVGRLALHGEGDKEKSKNKNKGKEEKKKQHAYPVWGAHISTTKASPVPPLGAPWLRAHARLTYPSDRDAVQSAVDAFFAAFNRREREAAALAKRLRSEPDEDGFVTVTRSGGGRTAPASALEAEEARQRMLARQEKRRDETTDFYRFQARERRKAEQVGLVRRFEDDAKKVAAMREKKGKFQPET